LLRSIEFFDPKLLQRMAEALAAAVATARLSGMEPSPDVSMARRVIQEAKHGHTGRLALTEAALDGTWS
jgi:hypothetical protein